MTQSGARPQSGDALDWPRTLAAKAGDPLRGEHLHYREARRQGGACHCFLLDCSASMVRHGGLALAKGLLLAWSRQLGARRERLAVIGFAGEGARLLKAPEVAAGNLAWLDAVPGGGGTPLAAGIDLAEAILRRLKRRTPALQAACWLLSDGRFTRFVRAPAQADWCALVDCEQSAVAVGRCRALARHWGAAYLSARDL